MSFAAPIYIYIYIYPLPFGVPSHSGYHSASIEFPVPTVYCSTIKISRTWKQPKWPSTEE